MNRCYHRIAWLIGTLVIPVLACSAQQPGPASPDKDGGWLSIGAGRGFPHDVSAVVSANFGRARVWQVAISSVGDISFGGEVPSIAAISVARGYSLVDRIGRIAVSAGPTMVWGKQRRTAPSRDLSRVAGAGLFTNVQLIVTPIKEIGLGIDIHANLNTARSVAGISVLLVIEGNK